MDIYAFSTRQTLPEEGTTTILQLGFGDWLIFGVFLHQVIDVNLSLALKWDSKFPPCYWFNLGLSRSFLLFHL